MLKIKKIYFRVAENYFNFFDILVLVFSNHFIDIMPFI